MYIHAFERYNQNSNGFNWSVGSDVVVIIVAPRAYPNDYTPSRVQSRKAFKFSRNQLVYIGISDLIKVALAHPAASNGYVQRQRSGFNDY